MEQEMRRGIASESPVGGQGPARHLNRNPRLEDLFRGRPEVVERLEKILRHPVLAAALRRTSLKDSEELNRELAEGFRASFPDLGDRIPTSIETIDFRAHAPDTKDGSGTTGTASDYLAQRIMGTAGMADLEAEMTLPPELQVLFERDADKLATFLVALDRSEPPGEEKIAA